MGFLDPRKQAPSKDGPLEFAVSRATTPVLESGGIFIGSIATIAAETLDLRFATSGAPNHCQANEGSLFCPGTCASLLRTSKAAMVVP